MLDHPRSTIAGLSLVIKFGLDPIYSFGDITIFIFCRLGLKLPIQAHFGEFWGKYDHPQKDHTCAETRCLSHKV